MPHQTNQYLGNPDMKYNLTHIARYAEGAMGEKERGYFENALAIDPHLRKGLEQYLRIKASLRMVIMKDPQTEILQETISSLNKKYFQNTSSILSFLHNIFRKRNNA